MIFYKNFEVGYDRIDLDISYLLEEIGNVARN